MLRIGLISDTHSLLRPQAVAFLRGCAHIIHAGDIGNAEILRELSAIAPVTAVRGNNDEGRWAEALPETAFVPLEETLAYVLHDRARLDIDPHAAGIGVVVSGHSHRPHIESSEGILYINPGSAGPRRFKLPIAVAELVVVGREVTSRIVELHSP